MERTRAEGWKGFKRTWSSEDITNIEHVLKKVMINADSIQGLDDTLTKQEKAWTANFAMQAFFWGCYRDN